MQVTPYLNFDGNCKAAFELYAKVLKGKIESLYTWGESPMAGEMPPGYGDKVMHASLRIGDSVVMGADVPPGQSTTPGGYTMSVHPDDTKEAERIFNALAEGGKVGMPLEATFWAAAFGMVTDKYGVPWTVNCENKA